MVPNLYNPKQWRCPVCNWINVGHTHRCTGCEKLKSVEDKLPNISRLKLAIRNKKLIKDRDEIYDVGRVERRNRK